jgi:tryptophan synthase alpha chain
MSTKTKESKLQVMTHMIPGYPDVATAEAAVAGLVEGGATHLEIQFPFSDPMADGPVIQAACAESLAQGFRVDDGFAFVKRAATAYQVPVFIMSYAALVYARGVDQFAADAAAAGAAGLIIPDLPVDSDEGLGVAASRHGLDIWPVVVPNISPERLELVASQKTAGIYAALRSGITGSLTEIGQDNLAFLERLRQLGDATVFAGFGIQEKFQVDALAPHVDGIIIGSALVKVIGASNPENVVHNLRNRLQQLLM